MEYSEMDMYMRSNLCAGATIIISGKRGGGKSHTAFSIVQNAIEGKFHLDLPVVCITNMVCGRVTENLPIEAYPDKVYHEDALAGTLRRIGQIITEYGSGNVIIIWVLDEAQNFMLSDMNGSKENLALLKFLGIARKFDLCNIFLTPALNNMVPRIRCFPEGDEKSGYCSCQMIKEIETAKHKYGDRCDPKSVTFHRESANAKYQAMTINSGSWTRGLYNGKLKVGEYSYDTKSTATFSIGKNQNGVEFNLLEFVETTSTGLSHELGKKIGEYFDRWDSMGLDDELPGEDPVKIRLHEQNIRVDRMRQLGIKWDDIARIEDTIKTTLQSRYNKFCQEEGSSKNNSASKKTNDENGVVREPVYIQPNKEEDGVGPVSSF